MPGSGPPVHREVLFLGVAGGPEAQAPPGVRTFYTRQHESPSPCRLRDLEDCFSPTATAAGPLLGLRLGTGKRPQAMDLQQVPGQGRARHLAESLTPAGMEAGAVVGCEQVSRAGQVRRAGGQGLPAAVQSGLRGSKPGGSPSQRGLEGGKLTSDPLTKSRDPNHLFYLTGS